MNFSYMKLEDSTPNLLKEGLGRYEIAAVCEEDGDGAPLKDRHGNDMIKILMDVTDANGRTLRINQFVTGAANMTWKLKQIAESVGMPFLYSDSGNFDAQKIDGSTGECLIVTEPRRGEYGPRSGIKKWLPATEASAVVRFDGKKDTIVDDDLPF